MCHVDDFVFAGTAEWNKSTIDVIMTEFNISTHFPKYFKYIGLEIFQDRNGVKLDQLKYISTVQEIKLASGRMTDKDAPLTTEEKSLLRSASGQLLWASTQTRPDMSYDACIVSNYGKEPTVDNIIYANKAIRQMKSIELKLVFPYLGPIEELKIICFADASHANLPCGASQGAYIIFIANNDNMIAPIMWQSKKLDRVTKSPLASETMVLADGADTAFLVASMLQEIFNLTSLPPIECRTDSDSLIKFLATSHVIQDSRLRVNIARIREMLTLKEISVTWVSSEDQLADSMTKKGASSMKLLKVLSNSHL